MKRANILLDSVLDGLLLLVVGGSGGILLHFDGIDWGGRVGGELRVWMLRKENVFCSHREKYSCLCLRTG